jgi:hypothetical protein
MLAQEIPPCGKRKFEKIRFEDSFDLSKPFVLRI